VRASDARLLNPSSGIAAPAPAPGAPVEPQTPAGHNNDHLRNMAEGVKDLEAKAKSARDDATEMAERARREHDSALAQQAELLAMFADLAEQDASNAKSRFEAIRDRPAN
jgi:hypothetical protein